MVKVYCQNCSGRCIGDVLKVGNNYFHQKCFKCKDCQKNLDSGGFYCRNGSYFCCEDYTIRFSNNCFICKEKIQSEIVSALNKHFHKHCFKCSFCNKTFSPGDKVVMKRDKFICECCANVGVSKQKPVEKVIQPDDAVTTDQGYFSGDPGPLSPPLPKEESEPTNMASETEEIDVSKSKSTTSTKSVTEAVCDKQRGSDSNSSTISRGVTNSLSRLRKQFQFGQFYNKSYLKMQNNGVKGKQARQMTIQDELWNKVTQQVSQQQQHHESNKQRAMFHSSATLSLSQSTTPITGTAVAAGRSKYGRGGISTVLSLSRLSTGRRGDCTTITEDQNHVVKQASYPGAQPPNQDEPSPLDRFDWPAPLCPAVYRRQSMFNKILDETDLSNESTTDIFSSANHSQSTGQLTNQSLYEKTQKLLQILYGPDKGSSLRDLNAKIISESRAPDARNEPGVRTRFDDHRDKSNSRNLLYILDRERHRKNYGFSMDYISSTSRPFMARCLDSGVSVSKSVSHNPMYSLVNGTGQNVTATTISSSNLSSSTYNMPPPLQKEHVHQQEIGTVNTNNNCSYEYLGDFGEEEVMSWSSDKSIVDLVTGLKKTRHMNVPVNNKRRVVAEQSDSLEPDSSSINTFTNDSMTIPYSQLIQIRCNSIRQPMKGLDKNNLEKYLSTDEFQMIFGLNKSDFLRLPIWKRNDLKKHVGLY